MKKLTLLFVILSLPAIHCHSGNKVEIDKTYVDNFEVNRYLGTWFEIARYPHSFEKNLQGVKANYSLQANGKIKVKNSGYKNTLSGRLKMVEGKAKMADRSSDGHLKVSFFLWFYADYYVLELDTVDYQYALVGSSSDKYLWVLARSPYVADSTINMLYVKAAQRGYDTTKLGRIKHHEPVKIDPLKAI